MPTVSHKHILVHRYGPSQSINAHLSNHKSPDQGHLGMNLQFNPHARFPTKNKKEKNEKGDIKMIPHAPFHRYFHIFHHITQFWRGEGPLPATCAYQKRKRSIFFRCIYFPRFASKKSTFFFTTGSYFSMLRGLPVRGRTRVL